MHQRVWRACMAAVSRSFSAVRAATRSVDAAAAASASTNLWGSLLEMTSPHTFERHSVRAAGGVVAGQRRDWSITRTHLATEDAASAPRTFRYCQNPDTHS